MSETRVNLKVRAPLFAAVLPDGAFVGCFTVPNMEWTEVPPRRISGSVNGGLYYGRRLNKCTSVALLKPPKMAMSVFPLIADDLVMCVCVCAHRRHT